MFSLLVRVAAATAAVGFSVGILAHRKATQAKEAVKEKISRTKTEVIHVKVPKGTDMDRAKITVYIPVEDE